MVKSSLYTPPDSKKKRAEMNSSTPLHINDRLADITKRLLFDSSNCLECVIGHKKRLPSVRTAGEPLSSLIRRPRMAF